MAPDLLSQYINRRNAPYIIWTVIAIVFALFFWLSSRTSGAPASGLASSGGRDASTAGAGSGAATARKRRTVSISLDGLLLGVTGSAADAAAAVFLHLCSSYEVFAIALAQEDATEGEVMQVLESMGAFDAGLRRHRVMFCSTSEGRSSMVRQLQPHVHLEAAASVAQALQGKVPDVRLIGSDTYPTLEEAAQIARSSEG
eukprot:TRINITY_DN27478_c0_g1_i1.p1 TRINITY_DN27478_c0_g1~~TRINITY_DN27478_c0_g1_i1.p1  ORF type:complete len:200 (+),score=38.10 TRINITY_DN27478_c0_g1_i1:135-734(+)